MYFKDIQENENIVGFHFLFHKYFGWQKVSDQDSRWLVSILVIHPGKYAKLGKVQRKLGGG